MPIKQAAKKDMRQNERRHVRNLRKKRELHTLEKSFNEAIKEKKYTEAEKILPTLQKKLDKAAKTYLHKSTASRKKSRLTLRLNKAKASK